MTICQSKTPAVKVVSTVDIFLLLYGFPSRFVGLVYNRGISTRLKCSVQSRLEGNPVSLQMIFFAVRFVLDTSTFFTR